MKTLNNFDEKIEKYFKENEIVFNQNYLLLFPKVKFNFWKHSLMDINDDFKKSIVILFNTRDIEIFSCKLKFSLSGMEVEKIGEVWEKIARNDLKNFKLKKKLIGYEIFIEKGKFENTYKFSKSYKKDYWFNKNFEYLKENDLI